MHVRLTATHGHAGQEAYKSDNRNNISIEKTNLYVKIIQTSKHGLLHLQ